MRRVLITGGSGGIGAATARACAAHGSWPIVGYARNRRGAEDVVRQCRVGEAIALDLLASEINLQGLNNVDAVVHCAGLYSQQRTLLGSERSEVHDLLEVNALGPWRVTEALLAQGSPLKNCLVLLSTAIWCRGGGPYALSKAAGLAMCKLLAGELAERQVRVHAIVPGWVETPMAEAAARATHRTLDEIRTEHPDHQLLEPDDVAELVVELLAEEETVDESQLITWDLRDSRTPVRTALNSALALHLIS